MQHQERMRAVGTHYEPTQIIGPTDHVIEGTAQLWQELIYRCYRLLSAPLSVTTTGRAEQPEDGPRPQAPKQTTCFIDDF